jgi:iron complex outermembrane receptor protein
MPFFSTILLPIALKKTKARHIIVAISLLFMNATASVVQAQAPVSAYFDEPVPIVLTTTRLKQSQSRLPGSITVIDKDMIAASGFRNLAELMRLAPGMVVGAAENGYASIVSYHGTKYRQSRRMQVLVDGRSVYQPGLASVNWEDIPVALADIERIEIARGPNAAAYGANAFLGVINITTRRPAAASGIEISAKRGISSHSAGPDTGSLAVEDFLFSASKITDQHQIKLSTSSLHDEGFDKAPQKFERQDGKSVKHSNLRWIYQPSIQLTLDSQLGYGESLKHEDPDPDSLILTDPDTRSSTHFLSTSLRYSPAQEHEIAIKAYYREYETKRHWQTCLPPIFISNSLGRYYHAYPEDAQLLVSEYSRGLSPSLPSSPEALGLMAEVLSDPALSASSNLCGTVNENSHQTQADLEIQHTWAMTKSTRLVYGTSIREDSAESKVFLNGKQTNTGLRAFFNAEIHLLPSLSTNIGGMYEDERNNPTHFSPRIGLNQIINRRHALRLVYSQAIRTPDMFENQANWSYSLAELYNQDGSDYSGPDAAPYYVSAQADGSLINEEITSREAGYFYNNPHLGITFDTKIFHDSFSELISQEWNIDNFTPENGAWLKQKGLEIELNYRPQRHQHLRINYANLHSQTNDPGERRFSPRHSGSVFYRTQLNSHWFASYGFYYTNGLRKTLIYRRHDVRVGTNITIDTYTLQLAGVMQHRSDDDPDLRDVNLYQNKTNAYLSAKVGF